ncbi:MULTISPECIES: ribulose-phosphate 3-epimerase [Dyadobacter]|uniref:Ribulose-phosphate 3-epimerase n=1 Tax=Dyadobacter chenhuakuii TaxID=2909339 RepID=A0ABY4XSG0_9BACT|nr:MULTISPECIES: ribulose-phosphate 3-epimerase [Dyadobacter]MCF2492298.1 ribulose-phosphate 3-epimerase [Dyadobacter chenhuakuii]MCF2516942.1 ribulose-phosphate 3-epimerase [Dyadobacter sp. CY351]USJ33396.1 ribulose-phosphate 3-epimerase [Dyadobacter chenhuakuii]
MAEIAPSILAADFANLQRDVEMLNVSQADYIHVDIMDGMFVPNISFGMPVCEAVHKHATKPLDVHLMIEQPDRYLEAFAKAGASILTVHYEACPHLHRTIQHIKEVGALPGVALNPHTPVEVLSEILGDVSLVLIMSVNPGFGGQKFIQNTYQKIARLQALKEKFGYTFKIEVDGGVNLDNAPLLVKEGVNILVAGSFVFSSDDPLKTITDLKTS